MRYFIFLVFLTFMGCAQHPISEAMRASLDPGVSISGLFESPDAYTGKKVMLAGNIVKTRNFPDKTEIEVVQKNTDSSGRLDRGDATMGRFIFRQRGYLESEVYSEGRDIIGAGIVVGSQSGKIGSHDYLFPVIEPEELHLLPKYTYNPYYYGPYYPYYGPYYPYYGYGYNYGFGYGYYPGYCY